jgi:hypothetical protein
VKPTNTREERHNVSLPPVLYKYYAFDGKYTPAIFERNEIYFQSADKLNDPFDMKIFYDVKGTYVEKLSWLNRNPNNGCAGRTAEELHAWASRLIRRHGFESSVLRDWKDFDRRERTQIGVFCMTVKPDNMLMWTHYAGTHEGFCLGWATADSFFAQARPISYSRRALRVRVFDSAYQRICAERLGLFMKARDWDYEEEWRIVKRNVLGIQPYPPDALSEVIFGCRIKPGRKKRIIKWCSQRETRPALYEAKPRERTFGLEIIPVPYQQRL